MLSFPHTFSYPVLLKKLIMFCRKSGQENFICKLAKVIALFQVFTKNKIFDTGISFYNSRDPIKLYV